MFCKKQKRKIEAYKEICRMADVPELIVDNPEWWISQRKPSVDDIDWAKSSIKEHESIK